MEMYAETAMDPYFAAIFKGKRVVILFPFRFFHSGLGFKRDEDSKMPPSDSEWIPSYRDIHKP
jgi:hypothetical protein